MQFLRLTITAAILAIATSLQAQTEHRYSAAADLPEWAELMYAESPDPGTVISAYELWYNSHAFVKNKHTQYYKRWVRSLGRVPGQGPMSAERQQELTQLNARYLEQSLALRAQRDPSSEWQCIGPFDFDKYAESRSYASGAAHIYTVEQAASNPNVLYAGTATAGVWKSTDKGENWELITSELDVNGVVSLEINHAEENVLYFGSNGLLYKTINGGTDWQVVGNNTFQAQNHQVKDLVMHPASTSELFMCSDKGLYHTVNGGNNWTELMAGNFLELEFHPTLDSIIYAVREVNDVTEFYRSTDAGATWSMQTNGWPAPITANGEEQARTEIAVTPAAPDNVYALATGEVNGGEGLYGIYVSTDQGATWEFRCCGNQPGGPADAVTNPNLTAWADDGSDNGGQYYYDLALDVSPTDANKVHVGAVNHWVSDDGGYNFTCPAKWSHSGKKDYVHADIHDIRYFGNDLWFACDGGVFYSDNAGDSIARKMLGIAGTDFWGFGVGFHDGEVMLGGTYHNGTLLKDHDVYENGWLCTAGGDNVRGFVNPANARWVYHDGGGRVLSGDRAVPHTNIAFDSLPNATYIAGKSSDMVFSPTSPNVVYVGRHNFLSRSEQGGTGFQVLYTFEHEVGSMALSRTNPDYLYVCTFEDWWGAKKVWRSADGGSSFTEITPPTSMLSGEAWVPYDIEVDSENPLVVWLARTSMYSDSPNMDGEQLLKSTDGGDTWESYSTSTLDGVYITNIVHQRGTDQGLYLGTRKAVYYRNATMSDWALFNNNLPVTTASTRLVPHYGSGKLRNGTNRSVYEVDLYEIGQPQAQIAADKFALNCIDNTVQFYDHSAATGNVTYAWTFEGGTPSTSNLRDPMVAYQTDGQFDVTLTVTDDNGSDTQTYTEFITNDRALADIDLAEDFEAAAIHDDWVLNNASMTFDWSVTSVDNGPDCEPTSCATANHFDINSVGDQGELITPTIVLTDVGSPALDFDYAYARYAVNYSDGFQVDVSADCGLTWDSIWGAAGDSLQTAPDNTEWWEPADCSDWQHKSFDLSTYWNDSILIRFVAINAWGNNFYLDNINVTGAVVVPEQNTVPKVAVYPNPSTGLVRIEASEPATVEVYGINGQLINMLRHRGIGQQMLELDGPAGLYLLRIVSENSVQVKRLELLR